VPQGVSAEEPVPSSLNGRATAQEQRVETPGAIPTTGTRYYMEFGLFWDDKPDGDVRVIDSITDGRGLRAFIPLADSFILSPSGTFIGE
jgi:hypothetical protein